MTIYLGNPMVPSSAPAGTGIGTLSADEGHTEIPSGGIAGQYSAKVNAAISLSVASAFTITAVAALPPPPAPPPAPPASSVPPTPVSLPSGVYRITSRGSGVDRGFGFYNQTPYVQLYPINSASGQQSVNALLPGYFFRSRACARGPGSVAVTL